MNKECKFSLILAYKWLKHKLLSILMSIAGNWVDIVVVGRVDGTIVAQVCQCLVEITLLHSVLHLIVDIALVDKFVLLWNFSHNRQDDLLVITWCSDSWNSETSLWCNWSTTTEIALSRSSWILSSHHCLPVKVTIGKDTLLPNCVGDEHLKQMVGHIVKPVNLLNVSTNDSFLFVEHTNSSIDFDIHVLTTHQLKWAKLKKLTGIRNSSRQLELHFLPFSKKWLSGSLCCHWSWKEYALARGCVQPLFRRWLSLRG